MTCVVFTPRPVDVVLGWYFTTDTCSVGPFDSRGDAEQACLTHLRQEHGHGKVFRMPSASFAAKHVWAEVL